MAGGGKRWGISMEVAPSQNLGSERPCTPRWHTCPTSHLECCSSSSPLNSPAPLGIFQNIKDSRGNKPLALG